MGRVTIAGEQAIGVDEAGGGDALPIIFLHGVGSDKSVWAPQRQMFGSASIASGPGLGLARSSAAMAMMNPGSQ